MEGQNTSEPLNKMLPKSLSIFFRGIIWGVIGAVAAGILFGFTYQLFNAFYYGSHSVGISSLVPTFISIGKSVLEAIVLLCTPIGFIMGLNTGIVAVMFGRHGPSLLPWLALSWIGVATGSWFAAFQYVGSTDAMTLEGLLLITFISSVASWMAYKSTIQKIKKSISVETSKSNTVSASLSNLLMIFIMIYWFVFWLEGINTP